jgi:hypothetical protein
MSPAEEALLDAATEVGQAYELFMTASGDEKTEAERLLHEAAHRVELILKNGSRKASGFIQLSALQAVIRGQLKTTIAAHGPITLQFVESATRRVAGDVLGHLRQASFREVATAAAALEVKRLVKELREANEEIWSKAAQIKHFIAKLETAGIPLGNEEGEQKCSSPAQ